MTPPPTIPTPSSPNQATIPKKQNHPTAVEGGDVEQGGTTPAATTTAPAAATLSKGAFVVTTTTTTDKKNDDKNHGESSSSSSTTILSDNHSGTDASPPPDPTAALAAKDLEEGTSNNTNTEPLFGNLSIGSANPSTRISLEEWAAFVQQQEGDEFADVGLAQIERIKVVHDRFVEDSTLSFNFNTLILVASVLAALGLVSNSVATIIASMLVSPIMGPVAGMAYGVTVRDWNLVKVSIINECGSLVFCILVGAVVGAISGAAGLADTWPTDEMAARGTITNFLVGLPIAFFSGLGVAVALLDEHFSSLVGVAISASLLPPAVNAGIMWVAYTFYDESHSPSNTKGEPYYGANEFRIGGLISLCLTLANVALVSVAAGIIFHLKEAIPMRKKLFWSDLAVARKIFQKKGLACSAEHLKVPSDQADQLYKQARIMSRTGKDE